MLLAGGEGEVFGNASHGCTALPVMRGGHVTRSPETHNSTQRPLVQQLPPLKLALSKASQPVPLLRRLFPRWNCSHCTHFGFDRTNSLSCESMMRSTSVAASAAASTESVAVLLPPAPPATDPSANVASVALPTGKSCVTLPVMRTTVSNFTWQGMRWSAWTETWGSFPGGGQEVSGLLEQQSVCAAGADGPCTQYNICALTRMPSVHSLG